MNRSMYQNTVILILLSFSISLGQGEWSTSALSEAKVQMGATSLDSKAYFGGGLGNNFYSNLVEIYDASTGEWAMDQLSVARAFPVGVSAGNKVFFAGGINWQTLEHFSTVDIYDTLTQEWTIGHLSTESFYNQAVAYENQVMFAGGFQLLSLNPPSYHFSDVVDIYDLSSSSWSTSNLSEARSGIASSVVGDVALFAGGLTTNAQVSDRVDLYNFSTEEWSTTSLSEPRVFCTAVTVGNRVLIAGGTNLNNQQTAVVDIYDHDSGTWSQDSLSAPRSFTAGAVSICGLGIIPAGGSMDLNQFVFTSASSVIDIYDPETETWTVETLDRSTVNHSAVGVENQMLIAGGISFESILSQDRVDILECDFVSAADDKSTLSEIELFPNPVIDEINIYIGKDTKVSEVQVQIFDLGGRLIKSIRGFGELKLSTYHLSGGIYLANIFNDKSSVTVKILKL